MDKQYVSQHGEDRALQGHFAGRSTGFFVEVGALDGVQFSNSFFFERSLGWKGVLIEAAPEAALACAQNRPASQVFAYAAVSPSEAGATIDFDVVAGYEALSTRKITKWAERTIGEINDYRENDLQVITIRVPTATLDDLLEQAACPASFEFVTIDIEGGEYPALRGFSLGIRWRPEVLLIENSTGMMDPRILMYLFKRGYGYKRTIVINDWYEPTRLVSRLLGLIRGELRGILFFAKHRTIQCLRHLRLLGIVRRAARRNG